MGKKKSKIKKKKRRLAEKAKANGTEKKGTKISG
jgi:ribosomal protein L32